MINDVTELITRDEKTFEYYIKDGINPRNEKLLNVVLNDIDKTNKINVPFVTNILQGVFPFIQKGVKQDIIDKAVEQGVCVHKMVNDSIVAKKGPKISLVKGDCKNANHIQFALRLITELNSFLYKYKIKYIYSEKTFINQDPDLKYMGTIDLLLSDGNQWFLIDFKTSRTNFTEKYNAQLFMYKKMIESINDFKINRMFILNPREDIVIHEYEPISKQNEYAIYNLVKMGI